ncbi:LysR family transcriptional regulator [Azotosporobacter soli]|uniref:LysR family transcriptional regulator n=1 Tax=Azotosporobacter soli TaxID=3055040 RepID=UPI0031FE7AF4
MEIIHLVYFAEVAQTGSFTKAAENLYVSQSTISKLIKNLENELGISLFERTSKGVILTEAGQLLIKKARDALTIIDNIREEMADLAGIPSGVIKIGIPPMVSALFPRIIGGFNVQYPKIKIDLIEIGSRRVERGLIESSIDIGVIVLPSLNKAELEHVPLLNDPLRLVCHIDHRLAKEEIVDFKDLQQESFVLYGEGFTLRDHILEKCEEHGFIPHVVCETMQWDFMVEIVASHLAVAFVPSEICKKLDPTKVKCLPLATEIKPWHLALAWKANGYLSRMTRLWMKFTLDHFDVLKNNL